MITSIKQVPMRYQLGAILDSRQPRVLSAWHKPCTVTVGNKFTYSRPMTKIIVRARYGALHLTHVFFKIATEERVLFPVYTKILSSYDDYNECAPVILHKESIEQILQILNDDNNKVTSLSRQVLDCVIDNIADDGNIGPLFDVLVGYKNTEYKDSLVNQGATILPGNDGKWDTSITSTEPIGLFHSDSLQESFYVPRGDALLSYLGTLANNELQDDIPFYHYPIATELDELFGLYTGNNYIKFDPIIRQSLKNIVVTPDEITRLFRQDRQIPGIIRDLNTESEEVIYPTKFTSNLLLFATFIQQLPINEISFTYILPTRKTPYSVQLHGASGIRDMPYAVLYKKLCDIVDITYYWKDIVTKIDVVMTTKEELWLDIFDNEGKHRVFIDLAVVALLSQTLSSN